MKFVIEVIEVEKCPADWVRKESWPAPGIYKAKDESYSMYHVHESGVDYISHPSSLLKTPYADPGEAVSEILLLKAIAAASRAEVLK